MSNCRGILSLIIDNKQIQDEERERKRTRLGRNRETEIWQELATTWKGQGGGP